MYFQVLFHRFRWLQLPATVLVVLLQRTPVLRILASEGPGICIRSGDLLRSAFAVAALGAYDSVAGATSFSTTVVSPTTASPTSTTATKTINATGTVGSPFSLALNVTGAPSSLKSWKVTGTFPPGLTVAGGTAVTGGFVFNSPLKVTISGTPTSAATSTLKIAAYSGLNATGDTGFVTCAITINGAATAPIFTTSPASQSVTVGSGVTFTAVVTGSPTPTLQWFKGTTALSGKTSATLSLTNVQLADADNYKLVATNSAAPDGVSSGIATLTVNAATSAPSFTTQPADRSVTVGSGVTFTAAVTGSPTPALQWFKGTTALSGKTSPTLSLTNVQLGDAGDYKLVATNSAAADGVSSRIATLTVNPAPELPVIVTPLPATVDASLGDTVTLSVEATGNETLAYSWQRGTTTLTGRTASSLTVGPLTTTGATTYTVLVASTAGQVTSSTVLTVGLPATATLTDPGTLKTGSAFTFDLSGGRSPVTGLLYKATGLPAGLALDPSTGRISGTITAKPGTAKLTLWTQLGTAKGALQTATLTIGAFPSALTGAYEALLFTADDTALPVGKIGLTVTSTGQFTGLLTSPDTTLYGLKGQLVLAADNTSASVILPVARGKLLPAYSVELNASTSAPAFSARLASGSTTVGTATDGDRLATVAPVGAVNSYTALLTSPVDLGSVSEFPRGTGFATAKINAKGAISFTGKFADGVKLTGTYPVGHDNRYRVFAKPYPKDAGGYFAAFLPLTARADTPALWHVAPADGSDAYWRKPDPLAATTSYGAGFGPLALTVRLEPWIKPSATTPLASLLGLDSTGDFAVAISSTGLTPDAFGLPATLHLDAKNLISVVSAATPTNPAAFTAKVNPATGGLTGGFTLAAVPPVALRKVAYTGVLLQPAPADQPGLVGGGFFLLPPATKGGDVFSGQVELTTP
jgi:hypothetical protein